MAGYEQGGATLSDREQEVAAAYVDGSSYKEIARTLDIAPATVRTHLRTLYRKLGVTSKMELANALRDSATPSQRSEQDNASLVAELALELDEAARRERILESVLRIIGRQGDRLENVIDAVLDYALEICEAEFGILFEYHGDLRYRAMQSRNIAPAFAEWLSERDVFAVDPDTGLGRVATSCETVNIVDVRGEDIYRTGAPLRIATADLGKARSFAAIPMMSGNRLIGAFTVYRTRVHPFNERSLEHANLFAEQAAIAIANARIRRPHATVGKLSDPAHDAAAPPMLAILPFQSVDDGDAELGKVGRRLAASIMMELSSNPLFRLIDQASSFSPSLAGNTPLEAAERLDAGLVVSGCIRRTSAGGYRVSASLHQAAMAAPRWTELLESDGANVDSLMDTLLERLCGSIGMDIERQLVDAARARHTSSATAMDEFLKGLELHRRHDVEDFLNARKHFESALDLDPEFSRAAAALAITYVREWFWKSTCDDLLDAAERNARMAIGLAPNDAWAQTVWGVVALYKRRHADAALCFDRAMELAPYDAYVVSRCALGKLYDGDFDSAAVLLQRSIELDPLHADRQYGMLGHALFHAGRYEDAISSLERIERPLSWELAWLACCFVMKGDEARASEIAKRYRESFSPSDWRYQAKGRPFRHEEDLRRLDEAMRRAGLNDEPVET